MPRPEPSGPGSVHPARSYSEAMPLQLWVPLRVQTATSHRQGVNRHEVFALPDGRRSYEASRSLCASGNDSSFFSVLFSI
jgi:hypothetical protein